MSLVVFMKVVKRDISLMPQERLTAAPKVEERITDSGAAVVTS